MAGPCHGPVRAAVGDAFSDAEIDDILERLTARQRERLKAEPTLDAKAALREAAQALTQDDLKAALIQKRMELAAARAAAERKVRLGKMGGKGSEALSAFILGDERQGFGRSLSVDAQGRALEADLWGDVERGLKGAGLTDRVASWWGGVDREFEERVAVEMSRANGGAEAATGDGDAVKVAEIFTAAQERGRRWQNDEGAWISKMEGYVVRQRHDAIRVAGGFWRELREIRTSGPARWGDLRAKASERAYQAWRDFTLPLLHERTFEGLDARALDDAARDLPFGASADPRERFLQKVWWDIVTGKHSILTGMSDTGDFRPPASKARSVSASRVLHYRDARAWIAYHRRFATGSLAGAVMSDLGRAAKNTALMRGFGPNPEAAFSAERERLLGQARDRNDAVEGKALTAGRPQKAFDQVNGRAAAPESLRIAAVGRAIRANESLSKLGGMVLSAFADVPVASQTLARAGVPFLDGYTGVLQGVARLGGADAKRVAELLDVGARGVTGHISSPYTAGDGARGWQSWAMRLFYRFNGFEFWNDGVRGGVAHMLSAHLGAESERGWDHLAIGTRETLERYGLDPHAWELIRRGAAPLAEDGGRRFLTFDALDQISDAEAHGWAGLKGAAATAEAAGRTREDLRLRLQTLFSEVLDTATSEARARETMGTQGGVASGTVLGEALRLFMQFKAFPLSYVGRQIVPATTGYAGKKPAALLAHLILATTLFGYVSMQAKRLAAGKELAPLFDEQGRADYRPWAAALVQGGGLGIYGDFLFGEYNRFGGSPLATLGGPAIGDAEAMLRLFGKLRDGQDGKASAVQFAKSNTPFINTWYAKSALDYLLFWRLNEAMNPGWAGRHEERVRKETGSGFWLKPTEAVQ